MFRDTVFTITVFLCLTGKVFLQCSVDLTTIPNLTKYSSVIDSLCILSVLLI